MVRAEKILSELKPFEGSYELLSDEQTVEDIMEGMRDGHKEHAKEYDKIAKYFVGATAYQTCKNIFDFLRQSTFYYMEDEMTQTVRSPAGIVEMGAVDGIDCKNYALFAGGVLDAINRSGLQKIPYVYRFASDKLLDPTPCHVFIVAFPGTDQEIYIDPIPPIKSFNGRIKFYYYEDKKYKFMPLYKVSGCDDQFLPYEIIGGASVGLFGWDDALAISMPYISSWVGSPDNSQAWDAGNWGWYIMKDTATHPAHNLLLMLTKNPRYIVDTPINNVGDLVPGINQYIQTPVGSPLTIPEKQKVITARLTQAGLGNEAQQYFNAWNNSFNLDGTQKANASGGGIIPPAGINTTGLLTTKNILIGSVAIYALGKWAFKWW
jgi:hypothetical protein